MKFDFDKKAKAKEKYDNCMLMYELSPTLRNNKNNKENLPKMQELLATIGVRLTVEDGLLMMNVNPFLYARTVTRYAGRHKKAVKKSKYEAYRYSDIVFMLQDMKDKEIAKAIGMPIATFYRHKKNMRESTYYEVLDLKKVKDKAYLESIPYNHVF